MSGPAAVVVLVLAAAGAAGPRARTVALTPDQQTIIAAVVDETFPRPPTRWTTSGARRRGWSRCA